MHHFLKPSAKTGDETLFKNIVLIETTYADMTTTYKSTCTGFSLSINNESWIITNRHCLDVHFPKSNLNNLAIIELKITFPDPKNLKPTTFMCDLDNIVLRFCPSGDLAAISKSCFLGTDVSFANLNSKQMVPNDPFYDNIHTGEQILFIGYPSKLWDSTNFLPILRTATISSIPSKDYGITGQNKEPRVLANGMSLGGGSGSPVFFQTEEGLKLIGVMSGHYYSINNHSWDSEIELDSVTAYTKANAHSGLSYFIKTPILKTVLTWPLFNRHFSQI